MGFRVWLCNQSLPPLSGEGEYGRWCCGVECLPPPILTTLVFPSSRQPKHTKAVQDSPVTQWKKKSKSYRVFLRNLNENFDLPYVLLKPILCGRELCVSGARFPLSSSSSSSPFLRRNTHKKTRGKKGRRKNGKEKVSSPFLRPEQSVGKFSCLLW